MQVSVRVLVIEDDRLPRDRGGFRKGGEGNVKQGQSGRREVVSGQNCKDSVSEE